MNTKVAYLAQKKGRNVVKQQLIASGKVFPGSDAKEEPTLFLPNYRPQPNQEPDQLDKMQIFGQGKAQFNAE